MIVESIAKDRGQKGEGMMMQIKSIVVIQFSIVDNDVYALVRTVQYLHSSVSFRLILRVSLKASSTINLSDNLSSNRLLTLLQAYKALPVVDSGAFNFIETFRSPLILQMKSLSVDL